MTFSVAGATMNCTPFATLCPRTTSAAAATSSSLPPVHEPTQAMSIGTVPTWSMGLPLAGEYGTATYGSSLDRSNDIACLNSALASERSCPTGQMPQVAPPSTVMFEMVERSSALRCASAEPPNSTTQLVKPFMPTFDRMYNIKSLAYTPSGSVPS